MSKHYSQSSRCNRRRVHPVREVCKEIEAMKEEEAVEFRVEDKEMKVRLKDHPNKEGVDAVIVEDEVEDNIQIGGIMSLKCNTTIAISLGTMH